MSFFPFVFVLVCNLHFINVYVNFYKFMYVVIIVSMYNIIVIIIVNRQRSNRKTSIPA